MHDMVTVRATYKEAEKLLMLSLTPLGWIGIPRWMCGKDMTQWMMIAKGYLAICFVSMVVNPIVVHSFTWMHRELLSMMSCFVMALMVIQHLMQIGEDVRMFYRMRVRLGEVILSNEGH